MREWRRVDRPIRSFSPPQRLEIGGGRDRALRCEAHTVLLGPAWSGVISPSATARWTRTRRDLHQPGGQPHALARIGERALAGQHPRILAAGTIEIGRRLLDEFHAFLEQRLERVGMDESAPEWIGWAVSS